MKKYSNEEYKALLTEIENIDFAEVKLENECEERVCKMCIRDRSRRCQAGLRIHILRSFLL